MNTKNSYNVISFVIFLLLITGAFTYFSFAEDTNLTLFEDFDRDGISNAEEETLGTNPNERDTDGDGYSDGVEVESGYNPLIPAPGDRIMQEKKPAKIQPPTASTNNVTKKISDNVVSHLADMQESGTNEITSEEFSAVVSEAVEKEIQFVDTAPVDLSEISIKDQSYDDLSSGEREDQLKEDATEYFTAISYIFISSFPEGFFEQSPELFQTELLSEMNGFNENLSDFSYFEKIAENSLTAESQMNELLVPEEMTEIHIEGIHLLRYAGNIYKSGSYKNVTTDAAPMIATLAQIQSLIDLSNNFQEKMTEKIEKYGIEDLFFEF